MFNWSRQSRRLARITLGAAAVGAFGAAVPARVPAQGSALAPGIALATFDTAWSRIDKTYFDTAFLATRWRVLRDSLRPLAETTTSNGELRRILTTLLASIETSHFGLIPREASPVLNALDASATAGGGGRGGVGGDAGAALRIAGDALIAWRVDPAGPAWQAGLRPGDRILAINGVALDSAVSQLSAITDVSVRRQAALTLAMRANVMLNGATGDTVALRVTGAGGAREVRAARRPLRGTMARLGNLPPMHAFTDAREQVVNAGDASRRIGIIEFSVWLPAAFPRIDSAVHRFRDADGLIIDLRGNPGGLAALTGRLAGHVVDSAYSLGALHMRASTLNLVANPQRVAPDGTTRVTPFQGPVAILMDPLSASASEFFAAGLQGLGRARVFGDTSAGASVPALMGRLPNGDVMLHAIADHLDPRGRRVEGRGVIPDEPFTLDRSAVAAGRDEPMEAAIRWINSHPRRSQSR